MELIIALILFVAILAAWFILPSAEIEKSVSQGSGMIASKTAAHTV